MCRETVVKGTTEDEIPASAGVGLSRGTSPTNAAALPIKAWAAMWLPFTAMIRMQSPDTWTIPSRSTKIPGHTLRGKQGKNEDPEAVLNRVLVSGRM